MPNKKTLLNFLIFLVLNFAALGIGSFLMGDGAQSGWYLSLNKAPWTPPGWVFGAAWTTIMVLFAYYMAVLLDRHDNDRYVLVVYGIQWVLNVLWNPLFFNMHWMSTSLVVIILLAGLIWYMLGRFVYCTRGHTVLLAPYAIWMVIATSLNAYAVFMN